MITLDEALNLDRKSIIDLHREYGNTALVSLLGMLNFDKLFVKAEGVKVWDSDGNLYLDFLGGYGSLNTGHNHPYVIESIMKVKERPNFLQASLPALAGVLANNIAEITPGDLKHCFFGNSGAEAVEGALKVARITTGKPAIISTGGSFHGKTMGALSLTGREKYQQPFKPLVPSCDKVPFNDIEALEERLKKQDVAAFIVEPIQGEGGIIIPDKGYLKAVEELCHKYGALFIADEIQTGLGRTGKMFACEWDEAKPDIMCIAKSISGGIMPASLFITTEEIWNKAYGSKEKCLLHTTTFGGNTWAAAAGIAALEVIIRENLPQKALELGDYLLGELNRLKEKHGLIKEVRGRGLLIGLEFEEPKGMLDKISGGALTKASQEYFGSLVAGELQNKYGIITAYTLNNPNVIRLEPPLIVTKEEIDQVITALDKIFTENKSFLKLAVKSSGSIISSVFGRK
ncbi:MAG: aspartate aminotransferase family protein [Firmicutes bacterium]|nr:aspartate aminotransferase family protein [Bacillota bacterium]MDD4263276.1 aspartate aminotransferase family protein [Bacillota bacterium]MDD4693157.1 aspartate aminotransferase family protein [Bacillota bacterium]